MVQRVDDVFSVQTLQDDETMRAVDVGFVVNLFLDARPAKPLVGRRCTTSPSNHGRRNASSESHVQAW
jgi:hypothetical protein